MKRFILLSFAFLAFGFYELSGGTGFDPEQARAAQIDARQAREQVRIAALPKSDVNSEVFPASAATEPEADETINSNASENVTRAALNLVSFESATQTRADQNEIVTEEAVAPITSAEILQLAEQQELSLDALENAQASPKSIAFAGSSIVSSSSSNAQSTDIRTVKGTLVNMRSGPGTDYEVVDQLSQSTQVEILTDSGNGWVELRPISGGTTGWIAEFLLTGG